MSGITLGTRDIVQQLMADCVYEFLEIQMQKAFGNTWQRVLADKAEEKVRNPAQRHYYIDFVDELRNRPGTSDIRECMDLTVMRSFVLYDFFEQCRVGDAEEFKTSFQPLSRGRNRFSHMARFKASAIMIRSLESLSAINDFLSYLDTKHWGLESQIQQAYIIKYRTLHDEQEKQLLNPTDDSGQDRERDFVAAFQLVFDQSVSNETCYQRLKTLADNTYVEALLLFGFLQSAGFRMQKDRKKAKSLYHRAHAQIKMQTWKECAEQALQSGKEALAVAYSVAYADQYKDPSGYLSAGKLFLSCFNNYEFAILCFSQASRLGNAEAQKICQYLMQMGKEGYSALLYDNNDVPKNYLAAYALGMLCQYLGESSQAIRPLEYSAEEGYADAYYELSKIYQNRLESADQLKALEYCQNAADRGLPEAQLAIAKRYQNGDKIVEQNSVKAEYWCRKAAEQNYWPAVLAYADMLKTSNPDNASAWLKKAADAGIPDAQYRYALTLLNEEEQAVWLLKAVRSGHGLATLHLGMIYESGNTPAAQQNAFELYSHYLDAHMDHPLSVEIAERICHLAAQSPGMIAQHAEYNSLLNRAEQICCNPERNYQLGLFYFNGSSEQSVMPDRQKAYNAFCNAAEKRHAKAAYNAAWIQIKDMNNPDVSSFIDTIHRFGERDVKNKLPELQWEVGNYIEAIRGYETLAKSGDANAQKRLGYIYMHGEHVQRDAISGLRYYQMSPACEQAHIQCLIGACYHNGFHDVRQDEEKALYWYQRAATQNDPEGLYRSGLLQCTRRTDKVQRSDGLKRIRAAAEFGYKDALVFLGLLYEGQLEDAKEYPCERIPYPEMASYYYRQASDQFSVTAKIRLAEILIKDESRTASERLKEVVLLLRQAIDCNKTQLRISHIIANSNDSVENAGPAYWRLGEIYWKVLGDFEQARQWLHQGAQYGDALCMKWYADLLLSSGNPLSAPEAFFWLENAVQVGYIQSITRYYQLILMDGRVDSEYDKRLTPIIFHKGISRKLFDLLCGALDGSVPFTQLMKEYTANEYKPAADASFFDPSRYRLRSDALLPLSEKFLYWIDPFLWQAALGAGYCLFAGYGCKKDYIKAKRYLNIAWAINDSELTEILYLFGNMKIDEGDFAKGIDVLKMSAEKGHRGSMLRLGECYEQGVFGQIDLLEASVWYRRSMNQGMIIGAIRYGDLQWKKAQKDAYLEAIQAYTTAINLYSETDSTPDPPVRLLPDGRYHIAEPIPSPTDMGHVVYHMAYAFYHGKGIKKDYPMAVMYYKIGAERFSHPLCMSGLAECYKKGRGVPKDTALAQDWDAQYNSAIAHSKTFDVEN